MKLGVEQISLETEDDNFAALDFYHRLGFTQTRHFFRYYMNGKGAFRMKKWLSEGEWCEDDFEDSEQK